MVRPSLVLLTAFIPSLAYASGNDVLSLFWLQMVVLLVVIAGIFASSLRANGNLFVLLAYAVGVTTPLYITSSWPYTENIYLINTLCTATPLAFFAVSCWIARRKFGKPTPHSSGMSNGAP